MSEITIYGLLLVAFGVALASKLLGLDLSWAVVFSPIFAWLVLFIARIYAEVRRRREQGITS